MRTFSFGRALEMGVFEITGGEARHIAGSLRLGPGDEIALIDGSGKVGTAEIQATDVGGERVRVRVFHIRKSRIPCELTVAASVPKDRRMEWMIEKCAELGAARIIPAVFHRSVVRPRDGRVGKSEKWRRISTEASKQSGRSTILTVHDFLPLKKVLGVDADLKILFQPSAGTLLPDLVKEPLPRKVLALIGPEGGIDPQEEAKILASGFQTARLAPHILRIETAAVAASAVILSRIPPDPDRQRPG